MYCSILSYQTRFGIFDKVFDFQKVCRPGRVESPRVADLRFGSDHGSKYWSRFHFSSTVLAAVSHDDRIADPVCRRRAAHPQFFRPFSSKIETSCSRLERRRLPARGRCCCRCVIAAPGVVAATGGCPSLKYGAGLPECGAICTVKRRILSTISASRHLFVADVNATRRRQALNGCTAWGSALRDRRLYFREVSLNRTIIRLYSSKLGFDLDSRFSASRRFRLT